MPRMSVFPPVQSSLIQVLFQVTFVGTHVQDLAVAQDGLILELDVLGFGLRSV